MYELMKKNEKYKHGLTPRLSGFEILNDATLIFQNWRINTRISRLFTNIFYNSNFP